MALERAAGNALQLMAEVVYSPGFLDFRPSLVAAGVLTSSRKAAGVWPFWPSSLAQLTGPLATRVVDRIVVLQECFQVARSVTAIRILQSVSMMGVTGVPGCMQ